MRKRTGSYRLKSTLVHLLLTVATLLFVFPIIWVLLTSIKSRAEAISIPPTWLFIPTITNYLSILQKADFTLALLNSTIIGLAATLMILVVGTPAAYSFCRFRMRGKGLMLFAILFLRVIPPISLVIPFYLMWRNFGLLDTYPAIIIMYMTLNLPLTVWMMRSFFMDVPVELEESVLIDGCSRFGAFFRIALPLVAPGMVATATISLMFCWNELLFAMAITGNSTMTAPLAVYNFVGYYQVYWGELSAAGIIVTVPIVVFMLIIQKHLIRGLTLGALKG